MFNRRVDMSKSLFVGAGADCMDKCVMSASVSDLYYSEWLGILKLLTLTAGQACYDF